VETAIQRKQILEWVNRAFVKPLHSGIQPADNLLREWKNENEKEDDDKPSNKEKSYLQAISGGVK
jgi:hypothetical protein